MYTTKLLNIIDDVMPRRSRIVLGAIVVFLVLLSIADAVSRRPAPAAVQMLPPIVVIATPTRAPAGAVGLAKQAAPESAVRVLAAATVTPLPIVGVALPAPAQVETIAQPAAHERPSDKAGPGE